MVFIGDNEQIFSLPINAVGFVVSEGDICNADIVEGSPIIKSLDDTCKAKHMEKINDLFDGLKRSKT